MIAVCAATKGRPKKLLDMVSTVPAEIPIYLYGTCLADFDEVRGFPNIFMWHGELSIIKANNFLIKKALGDNPNVSVTVGCDDIEYEEGAFDGLLKSLEKDNSLMYGLQCRNMECKDDAFVLFSNAILRETQGSPYHEEYLHFYADTELGDYYKGQRRFKVADAWIINHHPVVTGVEDETHKFKRSWKLRHDREVYESRNVHNATV